MSKCKPAVARYLCDAVDKRGTGMTTKEAINTLIRLQEPEPYEPPITAQAFEALQMAIEALKREEGTHDGSA